MSSWLLAESINIKATIRRTNVLNKTLKSKYYAIQINTKNEVTCLILLDYSTLNRTDDYSQTNRKLPVSNARAARSFLILGLWH